MAITTQQSSSNLTTSTTPAFLFTSAITRVNNVLPYAADTVYGGPLQLVSNVTPKANQWLLITDVSIFYNFGVVPPGMTNFQLYVYKSLPPSAVGDTGAFSVPLIDEASIHYPEGLFLGSAKKAKGGGSVVLQMNNINVPIQLTGTSFFAYLVSIGAFTPAAALETAMLKVRTIAL